MDRKLILALVISVLVTALAVPAIGHNSEPPQSPRGDRQTPASRSR